MVSLEVTRPGRRAGFCLAAMVLWCCAGAPCGHWKKLYGDCGQSYPSAPLYSHSYYKAMSWVPFLAAFVGSLILWSIPTRSNKLRFIWFALGGLLGCFLTWVLIAITGHFMLPNASLLSSLDGDSILLTGTGALGGIVAGVLRGKMDSGDTRADLLWDIGTVGVAVWIAVFRVLTCDTYMKASGQCYSALEPALYLVTLIPVVIVTIPVSVLVYGMRSRTIGKSIAISSVIGLGIILAGTLVSSLLHVVLFFFGLPLVYPGRPVFLPALIYAPLLALIWGGLIGIMVSRHPVSLATPGSSG